MRAGVTITMEGATGDGRIGLIFRLSSLNFIYPFDIFCSEIKESVW